VAESGREQKTKAWTSFCRCDDPGIGDATGASEPGSQKQTVLSCTELYWWCFEIFQRLSTCGAWKAKNSLRKNGGIRAKWRQANKPCQLSSSTKRQFDQAVAIGCHRLPSASAQHLLEIHQSYPNHIQSLLP